MKNICNICIEHIRNAKLAMEEYLKIFQVKNYHFEMGEHKSKSVIWISFPYRQELINHLKNHTKAKWSATNKKWYVADATFYRNLFGLEVNYYSKSTLTAIHGVNLPAMKRYVEQLQLKAYSQNTIRTYVNEFSQLLKTIKSFPVDQLSAEKLRSYFLFCINEQKLSENMIHSRMNAVKFYFEQVLDREKLFLEIPRPKKPSTLPKAISTQDIKRMFEMVENTKHKLLLKLCYGMGLRVSEIINLRIMDIDSKRMQVLVRQSKGKKDRYINLPESVLSELRNYYLEYKPGEYLFEGRYGAQYSVRSVQVVFKNAMKKAKINKRVGVHSLRHSYATHLIEQGTDIRFVQDLLGHKNIKTTMIYTNLTDQTKRKIQSPLDSL